MESIIKVTSKPCPKCGGKQFQYNAPKDRIVIVWRGIKTLVRKYTCIDCGMQLD